MDSKMLDASHNESQLVNHVNEIKINCELSTFTSDNKPNTVAKTVDKNNNNKDDNTNVNEKRNYEFDSIYKNKKNLPLLKRFKNYLQEESLNNNNNNTNQNAPSQSSVTNETHTSLSIAEINGIIQKKDPLNNDASDSANLKLAPQTTSTSNENENKLLGLANIALERETN